jgi:hypothetical protein
MPRLRASRRDRRISPVPRKFFSNRQTNVYRFRVIRVIRLARVARYGIEDAMTSRELMGWFPVAIRMQSLDVETKCTV